MKEAKIMSKRNNLSLNYFPIILNYGVILAIIFSMIFLMAKILHLEQVTWLRYINYIIYFPIAYSCLRKNYRAVNKPNYFEGLMIGFLTCLSGQLIFTILIFIYLHFDSNLLSVILSQIPNGILHPEISISFILFSEGLAWSAITSFSLMQIFKWKRGSWSVES